jgi:hypothetical protein
MKHECVSIAIIGDDDHMVCNCSCGHATVDKSGIPSSVNAFAAHVLSALPSNSHAELVARHGEPCINSDCCLDDGHSEECCECRKLLPREGGAAFRDLTDDQRKVLRRCFHADGTPKTVYPNGASNGGDPKKVPYWCDVHQGFHKGSFRDGDSRKVQNAGISEAQRERASGLDYAEARFRLQNVNPALSASWRIVKRLCREILVLRLLAAKLPREETGTTACRICFRDEPHPSTEHERDLEAASQWNAVMHSQELDAVLRSLSEHDVEEKK